MGNLMTVPIEAEASEGRWVTRNVSFEITGANISTKTCECDIW